MEKRSVILILCVLLLTVLVCPAFAAGKGQMKEGSMYVNTANHKTLHFRLEPKSASDNIIGEIPYGAKVFVVSWSGGWARVKYNGMYGYVSTSFLSAGRPGQQDTGEKETVSAEVSDGTDSSDLKAVSYDVTVVTETSEGTVKMLGEPRMSAPLLMLCENGTRLSVIGENRDWAQVVEGESGTTGYMLKTFLVEDLVEEEILEDEWTEDATGDEYTENGFPEETSEDENAEETFGDGSAEDEETDGSAAGEPSGKTPENESKDEPSGGGFSWDDWLKQESVKDDPSEDQMAD